MKNILYYFIIIINLLFLTSCEVELLNEGANITCLEVTTEKVNESITIREPIDALQIDIPVDITLYHSPFPQIEIYADPTVIEFVLDNNEYKNGLWTIKEFSICPDVALSSDIDLRIGLPTLKSLTINKETSVRTEGVLQNIDSLFVQNLGGGNIDLRLDTLALLDLKAVFTEKDNFTLTNNFILSGQVKETIMDLAGRGEVRGFELHSQTCTAHLSENYQVETVVDEKLTVQLSNNSHFCYRGNPEIAQEVANSAELKNCN